MNLRHFNIARVIDDSKRIEQPDHDADHYDDVKDLLDLTIHRYVGVNEPKEDADDNEGYDNSY